MFQQLRSNGKMVEVLSLSDLFNPNHPQLVGRYNAGEELQDPEKFDKSALEFLSGEPLPRCWLDIDYRDNQAGR